MGKYGVAAIAAVRAYTEGKAATVEDAWAVAVQKIFPNSPSSQLKSCPRGNIPWNLRERKNCWDSQWRIH